MAVCHQRGSERKVKGVEIMRPLGIEKKEIDWDMVEEALKELGK